ncbi:hypothetical protein OIE63_06820 [Streptomyces sp. NBC_01795]|uniref:hypothetical protein n=1 Tax=Streptomyces sp. NBC_01795 TaxID=2975943 RepID=UPI002DDC7571|nr:hypothetical protein [Streptomyces sp. NBC_01795]WSA91293.1 hypothetical protein OIE63_06820 [Streptomyces sp. NBC_01795]
MTAPDDREGFALRWQTSTPSERRTLMRQGRESPETARQASMLAGVLFAAGGIAATAKAVNRHESPLVIGGCVAAVVLCAAMAELSRRGRTRVGMTLMVVGLITLSLVETL